MNGREMSQQGQELMNSMRATDAGQRSSGDPRAAAAVATAPTPQPAALPPAAGMAAGDSSCGRQPVQQQGAGAMPASEFGGFHSADCT